MADQHTKEGVSPFGATLRMPLARAAVLILVDCAAWALALATAAVVRFDFDLDLAVTGGLARAIAIAVVLQVAWGAVGGLYPGRWRLGSFREIVCLGVGVIFISTSLVAWVLLSSGGPRPVPLSVPVTGSALFFFLAAASRLSVRVLRERAALAHHDSSRRAIIFGAGDAGHEIVEAIRRDPRADFRAVAVLDDDLHKARLRIGGCRVLGTRSDIARVAAEVQADLLVIAMPSAARSDAAAIARAARSSGLEVLILPSATRFLTTSIEANQIRPLRFEDFLGRDPARLDLEAMASYVSGRAVLVTGAGGSIGSELSMVIHRLRPRSLTLLDRDENALHSLELRLSQTTNGVPTHSVLADIRDPERLADVFTEMEPEVVFHAAALKHVPVLERFPSEAVKTNVFGLLNVIDAARRARVTDFVNISTDKAAEAANVLGLTKRLGEMLVAAHSDDFTSASSVRFGNVLGTSGSVIPTFTSQILAGGPVTITHRDVTRYFMTVEEAVHLVVQAAAIRRSGEVLVLEMGDPVPIVDLARALIDELAPMSDIELEEVGLRPGEKLHEVLVGPFEMFSGSPHEGISSYAVPPLARTSLDALASVPFDRLKETLLEMVRDAETLDQRVRTSP